MRMAVSVAAVVVLSLLVFISVYTLLDSRVREDRARRNAQADVLLDAVESSQAESSETETVSETQVEETTETTIDMLAPSVASAETEALSETAAEAGEETSEVQVEETAAAVDSNAVEEYYASVYAASDINLRSGPGTDYDIVRNKSTAVHSFLSLETIFCAVLYSFTKNVSCRDLWYVKCF